MHIITRMSLGLLLVTGAAMVPARAVDPSTPSPKKFPDLVIDWDSVDHLMDVSERLGMRVVALTGRGHVLGQVGRKDGVLHLHDFDGRLSRYHGRMLRLPADFFGDALSLPARAAGIAVLVPEQMNDQLISLQSRAISRRKLIADQVGTVAGRFRVKGNVIGFAVSGIYRRGEVVLSSPLRSRSEPVEKLVTAKKEPEKRIVPIAEVEPEAPPAPEAGSTGGEPAPTSRPSKPDVALAKANRSVQDHATGIGAVRQQMNELMQTAIMLRQALMKVRMKNYDVPEKAVKPSTRDGSKVVQR